MQVGLAIFLSLYALVLPAGRDEDYFARCKQEWQSVQETWLKAQWTSVGKTLPLAEIEPPLRMAESGYNIAARNDHFNETVFFLCGLLALFGFIQFVAFLVLLEPRKLDVTSGSKPG